jgi:uncharacterized membrane protein
MNIGKYITNTIIAIVALFVVFFGFAAILAIFENVTWNEVWSISAKVGLVALVLLAINVVIAVLVGLLPGKSGKK